jgi:hypothetical protein
MIHMTVYVDTDHAHDLVTRRSITGILLIINDTPIIWVSNRQKNVETSSYTSAFMTSRNETKLILEVRIF